MPIIRKVGKLGGSYTLTVPPDILQHLGVNKGDYLVWTLDKDRQVLVEKLTPKKYPGFFIPGSGWLKRGR